MTPAETEKALRALFKQLRPPARAICHFPKPPQRREVCGFSIFYRGALVREYFVKELIREFKKTSKEKDLWADTCCCVSTPDFAPSVLHESLMIMEDGTKIKVEDVVRSPECFA